MNNRKGDWIQTFSGIQFWPLDPREEEIHAIDIAHSLSMMCRFAGHCENFYSVAEHSCLISDYVPAEHKLWALLHDASEAYLVDVPRPIKSHLQNYKELETALMKVVCKRFKLIGDMPHAVKMADNKILVDEMTQNLKSPPAKWSGEVEGLGLKLKYWSPQKAKQEFLNRLSTLGVYK